MNAPDTGRAWIELDMDALRHNVAALKGLLPPGCQLMGAVKADAYGHGAVSVARELNALGVRAFCVADTEEGAALRRVGICGDILVLGYSHPFRFPQLQRYRLTQTIPDADYAREMDRFPRPLQGHIKVDTGMHRLGVDAGQLREIERIFRCENVEVTGIYTHLYSPDPDRMRAQAAAFRRVLAALDGQGLSYGRAHLLSSAGLLRCPALGGDYARVGIALYGVLSRREELERCPVELRPVLSVKARVAQVKTLRAGEGAGYAPQYIADRDRTIAILAIGYADGLPRSLSNGAGQALIRARSAPILGSVCMDQTIVDVTHIRDVKSGDIAVLLGRSGSRSVTAYDWAEAEGTITNEILSRLGPRLRTRTEELSPRR